MSLTQSGLSAPVLKDLLESALRHQSLDHALRGCANGDALKRRIHDIRRGNSQKVTLSVADQICTAFGRPDWLQLL